MRRGLDEIRHAKEALHSGDTTSVFIFAKGLRPQGVFVQLVVVFST